jgi:hypothetical protein
MSLVTLMRRHAERNPHTRPAANVKTNRLLTREPFAADSISQLLKAPVDEFGNPGNRREHLTRMLAPSRHKSFLFTFGHLVYDSIKILRENIIFH